MATTQSKWGKISRDIDVASNETFNKLAKACKYYYDKGRDDNVPVCLYKEIRSSDVCTIELCPLLEKEE